ncbi:MULTISPECIES: outer membrane protein [unclassified Rhizobium]|uniref:outer membrane protein n=1 Tax=unclassified Rhizobium TaxID=2613769 RepID=UPI000715B999|nr:MULTISPECIES: outer membrane protein [unclassified Rhizobium]KQS84175.1 cell envelope biogenesis protein OmpA [Rhizobium sp. Leaf386]KQT00800.1 cell envelope biogenesis protein OmpA [Rhizobium sp. Leaf391]KQU08450.1 cell envelope biogenesis protein OmpA [Rhizobium sp. Leaf453]
MNKYLIAIAAGLLATSASAADLVYEEPPVVVPMGGWYLRGDLGMSNQRLGSLEHPLFNDVEIHDMTDDGGFGSAPTAAIGVGYQFNDWLRADGFVQYRGNAEFTGADRYGHTENGDVVWDGTNDYSGEKSEWLLMANAYVDIGEWYGITPYVGAGIGASRNTISHFRDVNVPTGGFAYADSGHNWDFAWALHAGLAYKATDRLTVDFGYSYLDLGDGETGGINAYDDTVSTSSMKFKDITSHDFKMGLRYSLQ